MRRFFARTLALESRMIDSILVGNNCDAVDAAALDPEKMAALEQHEELLTALDKWIQMPDPRLYTQLADLSEVVRQTYQLPARLLVFRGFDLHSPYQNTMGLSTRGLMGSEVTVKGVMVGAMHRCRSEEPISCTTDEKIARAFGKIVVNIEINPSVPGTLVVTPELCALVCKRRNIDLSTQKEVILLPPVDTEFQISSLK